MNNDNENKEELIRKERMEADFIGMGFKKLDSNLISEQPPKIKWGAKYLGWSKGQQVKYLEKLACTMNHAASLIQTERNALLKKMDVKEAQVVKLQESLNQNNAMLQSEVTKMNEMKQKFNEEYSKLKRELEECRSSKE